MQTQEIQKPVRPLRRASGAVAAAALIGVLAIGTSLVPVGPYGAATADTMPHATGTTTGMMPADFTDVIERVSPAVVNIQVTEKAQQAGETAEAMPKGVALRYSPSSGVRTWKSRTWTRGRDASVTLR